MNLEREGFLEELPDWKWETNYDDVWIENYNLAKNFIEENKKYPSIYSSNKEEGKMMRWITNQKACYRATSRKKLNKTQIELLENIPNWKWTESADDKWMTSYNLVKLFIEKNGVYPSQHSTEKTDVFLYRWVQRQRDAMRGKGTYTITENRIKLIEQLPNWRWSR